MRKKSKIILSLLLTLALLVGVLPGMSAWAELPHGDCGPNATWSFDGSTLTISGTGAMVFDGQVPWYDFKYQIGSVVIEGGVTSIGNNAFYGCYYMTSARIPGSVTSIGDNAFRACTNLTSVSIPSSVTSIGEAAFYRCTSLTSVSIPSSVTSIDAYAFTGCTSLTSLVIPNGVTSIGYGAFSGCTSLTSLVIPNGVTSIGDGAFYNCTSLTSLVIPGSVTSIGESAFRGANFTSVTFEPGENGAPLTIGDKAFYNESTTLAYGSGNTKLYYENGEEVAAGTKMNTLSGKILTWKSTGYTVTYAPGDGATLNEAAAAGLTVENGSIVRTVAPENASTYKVEGFDSCFNAPEGKQFDVWKDLSADKTYRTGSPLPLTGNVTLTAQWKDASQGDTHTRGGLSTNGADVVFNIPGMDDGWEYIGGGVPQRAYRLSFAPMQGGSAYFLLNSGENGETMNVYPQTSVRVVPTPAPGYRLASIVWSMIDGSASYDITETQSFVMPAMDAVVYVIFQSLG